MNIEILQKLARNNRWQIIYNRCKEIGSLKLFNNTSDLSNLQITFCYMLELYHILYQDLNSGEEYISEEIIEDPIRTEAYLLLRKEKKEKKNLINTNKRTIDTTASAGSVLFRRKVSK